MCAHPERVGWQGVQCEAKIRQDKHNTEITIPSTFLTQGKINLNFYIATEQLILKQLFMWNHANVQEKDQDVNAEMLFKYAE